MDGVNNGNAVLRFHCKAHENTNHWLGAFLPSLFPHCFMPHLQKCLWNLVKTTYNFLVSIIPTAVCCGQCWRALLCIPGRKALLRSAADGDCVDTVCVAITVTVVSLAATVPRSPDKNGAFSLSPLQEWKSKELLLKGWTHCWGRFPVHPWFSPFTECQTGGHR